MSKIYLDMSYLCYTKNTCQLLSREQEIKSMNVIPLNKCVSFTLIRNCLSTKICFSYVHMFSVARKVTDFLEDLILEDFSFNRV